jgi:hypothetical protein
MVADSVTHAPFEGLGAGTEQVGSTGGLPPHSVPQEAVKQALSASTDALLSTLHSAAVPVAQSRQPAVSLQVASSMQQPASRQVTQSLGCRMPEQSTGGPPPVPVAPDVVLAPVVVPPVVVVCEPVVEVGEPVVVSPPPLPPAPVEVELVVPPLHARGRRGVIAAATRIQEYFCICCSLEE